MNAKHTPGPWDIHETDSYGFEIHPLSDEEGIKPIADIPVNEYENKDEARANATLIASAPELLEALKEWEAAIPRMHDEPAEGSFRAKALRAIAKAEGR